MTGMLRKIFLEILGLFIDDGFLALAILAVVAAAAFLVFVVDAPKAVAGGVLLIGCLGALTASVGIASRKR